MATLFKKQALQFHFFPLGGSHGHFSFLDSRQREISPSHFWWGAVGGGLTTEPKDDDVISVCV